MAPFGILIVAVCALLVAGAYHESLNPILRFDREGIARGEWWRLITGHYVHLSLNHAAMNAACFGLLGVLFQSDFGLRRWYGAWLFVSVCVALALWWGSSEIQWYVGLSGALYGMSAAGLLLFWRRLPWLYGASYALVVCKVLTQPLGQDTTAMSLFIGGDVIAVAHLYGLVAGHLWVLLIHSWGLCRRNFSSNK